MLLQDVVFYIYGQTIKISELSSTFDMWKKNYIYDVYENKFACNCRVGDNLWSSGLYLVSKSNGCIN